MTTAIEYKELSKVSPTGAQDEFKVEVELTAAPPEDWVEEFTQTMNASPMCPNVEIDDKVVTFCASDQTIKRGLQRLRTAIARTNIHLYSKKNKPSKKAKDVLAEIRAKKAAKKEAKLKGEGF